MTSYTRALELAVSFLGTALEMRIIRALLQAPRSFDQLLCTWTDYSKAELLKGLRHLEARGVIKRKPDAYSLTAVGESLGPIFQTIEENHLQHP